MAMEDGYQEDTYWTQFEPAPDPGFAPRESAPGTIPPPVMPTPDGPIVGPGMPAPGQGGGRQQFGEAWQAYARTKPPNVTYVDWLKQFVAQNPQYGVTLGGSKGDKVYGPGGEYWADGVISAGINGGTGATWNESTGGGAGGQDGFGAYTDPFTERFSLPSLEDLQHMPGYQAGLDAYRKGIETSAASKGTLLTGGTLQRLGQAGTDYANQAYGQLSGLSANEFGINRDIFYRNQDAPFNKYATLADLGRP